MNAHEAYEELMALRLYGELDAPEVQRLDEHLRDCAACRARADELGSSLGALAAPADDAGFSAAARARLERALARERRGAWRPASAALLGFAAGLLCALALVIASRASDAQPRGLPVASAPSSFARATPPPAAQDRGLGELLRTAQRR